MRSRKSIKTFNRNLKRAFSDPITGYCFDCGSYFKNTPGKGECVLIGEIVRGSTQNKPCWKGRDG